MERQMRMLVAMSLRWSNTVSPVLVMPLTDSNIASTGSTPDSRYGSRPMRNMTSHDTATRSTPLANLNVRDSVHVRYWNTPRTSSTGIGARNGTGSSPNATANTAG